MVVSKTELKNGRGRNSFTEKNKFGLSYVGFEVPVDHPGGDIENIIAYRSWSSGNRYRLLIPPSMSKEFKDN